MPELSLPLTETEFFAHPPAGSYQLQQLTECGWEPQGDVECELARISLETVPSDFNDLRLVDHDGRVVFDENGWRTTEVDSWPDLPF